MVAAVVDLVDALVVGTLVVDALVVVVLTVLVLKVLATDVVALVDVLEGDEAALAILSRATVSTKPSVHWVSNLALRRSRK